MYITRYRCGWCLLAFPWRASNLLASRRRRPCVTEIARGTINLHRFLRPRAIDMFASCRCGDGLLWCWTRTFCGIFTSSILYRNNRSSRYDVWLTLRYTHARDRRAAVTRACCARRFSCRSEERKDSTVARSSYDFRLLTFCRVVICEKWDLMILFVCCISRIYVTHVADGRVIRTYTLLCYIVAI